MLLLLLLRLSLLLFSFYYCYVRFTLLIYFFWFIYPHPNTQSHSHTYTYIHTHTHTHTLIFTHTNHVGYHVCFIDLGYFVFDLSPVNSMFVCIIKKKKKKKLPEARTPPGRVVARFSRYCACLQGTESKENTSPFGYGRSFIWFPFNTHFG